MNSSACSAVICQPSGHEQKHDTNTATNPRRIKDPPRLTNCTTIINPEILKYPLSVHPNMVLIILMVSLILILASLGFIVW